MQEEQYTSKKINSIVFGVFSPKQIHKMAAVKIVTPELYDKEGYPVDGGPSCNKWARVPEDHTRNQEEGRYIP